MFDASLPSYVSSQCFWTKSIHVCIKISKIVLIRDQVEVRNGRSIISLISANDDIVNAIVIHISFVLLRTDLLPGVNALICLMLVVHICTRLTYIRLLINCPLNCSVDVCRSFFETCLPCFVSKIFISYIHIIKLFVFFDLVYIYISVY